MIILTPRIDVGGERWFFPYKRDEKRTKPYTEEEEAKFRLRLLVVSSENHQFRSMNALVRRHIDKLDASYHVGTRQFDISSVGDIDSIDDLLINNCARHLLKDWEGVGELIDGKDVPIEYSPENGIALLKQNPELYWMVLAEAASIAQGKERQKQETVKKPSKRNNGSANSAGRRAKRQSGAGKS